MNTIVDAFRKDGAFIEIGVEVDIPNYRFGMFRLKAGKWSAKCSCKNFD
jgi:hypothetical protein